MRHEEIGAEADLVDLVGLSLVDLKKLDDSALGHALRRVLADTNNPEDAIAAFQSYLEGQSSPAQPE